MEASTVTKARTFVSKCHNQKMFFRADDFDTDGMPNELRDPNGRKYGQTDAKLIEFESNQFVADEDAARKLGVTLDDLLSFLRGHELFDATIFEEYMPEAEEPTVKSQIASILAATARADADAVQSIIDGERDLHNRDHVLQAGTAALEQLAEIE